MRRKSSFTPKGGNRMTEYHLTIAGDSALNVVFGEEPSLATGQLVRAAARAIKENPIGGVTETVPALCSLMVCYNPLVAGYDDVASALKTRLDHLSTVDNATSVLEIPVCYGGEFGPDLEEVAQQTNLTPQDVVNIHSGTEYFVGMLGFQPGFAYLGGMDARIRAPRLASPNLHIPAGAVGIGGQLTGIYPAESPGGWQIIGRTPIKPYDTQRDPIVIFEAGQRIRFLPISPDEFRDIQARVTEGTYVIKSYTIHPYDKEA